MKHFLLLFTFIVLSISNLQAQNNLGVVDQNSSSIYPNPATSQVNIKFAHPGKVANIAIYSIIGNEVLNKKIDQSTNFKINIQNLKKGKYIVRVFNTDGSTESLSLIKN